MKYIVIFDVFNSNEVYYCDDLDQVKQTIEKIALPEEIEKGKVRVFKIASELNLQNLPIQTEKEEEYDLNKLKEHIREIFHPEKPTKTSKYQRPKPPWITYEKLLKSLTKKGR